MCVLSLLQSCSNCSKLPGKVQAIWCTGFYPNRANGIVCLMRVLYHLPLSPYSRKVRLVLAEKRLPFDLKTEKVWDRQPAYLELNPACTVPTLVEDSGLVVPDSRVICEYLEEAYP